MRENRLCAATLVLAVMVSTLIFTGATQAGTVTETVLQLPVGADGITYAGLQDEMERWGPTALTVDQDGRFWIADAAAARVLCVTPEGGSCGAIDLDGLVRRASDIEVAGGSVWVLDTASMIPAVLRLSLTGKLISRQELPAGLQLTDGLTGLHLGEHGEVLVELENGASYAEVVTAAGEETRIDLDGFARGGTVYRTFPADMASAKAGSGTIDAGGKLFEVSGDHAIGGLSLLDVRGDGSFTVVAEEVMINDTVLVDQTVRRFSADGAQLDLARVPLAEQEVFVPHSLAVGPDGSVFTLVTTREAVEVRRLGFSSTLAPILPPAAEMLVAAPPARDPAKACVSWSTMITWALGYLYNSHYYTSTNINGYCAGRGKPAYLGSAGTYSSVAYDWGGFDTYSAYNSYLDSGYQAGDTDDAASESCSRGVDCSGFVSRCWKLTSKYSTRSLPNISWKLSSTSYLADGDIMNKYNSHVVMFTDFGSGGIYVYESTTGGYDRVVYQLRTWAALSGYEPRRYNNKC